MPKASFSNQVTDTGAPVKPVSLVKIKPTGEQKNALSLFLEGNSLLLEAGAGCGKTSTLAMMARTTDKKGQYVAFNKALVMESAAKFPSNVPCRTAHSLAYGSTRTEFKERTKTPRWRPSDLAKFLHITPISIRPATSKFDKVIPPYQLAGLVEGAIKRFCQTADKTIKASHFPLLKGIDLEKGEDYGNDHPNNDIIRAELLPVANKMWKDLCDPKGILPYGHHCYLKQFELNRPRIYADFILCDEAQDLAPVLLSIVQQQTDAQLVFVGDSQQQIYEWTGAVNAMKRVKCDKTAMLSQSFRFGQAIADEANAILEEIPDAVLRLKGNPAMKSKVGPLKSPKAILTRTNATGVEALLLDQERKVHIVGGGKDVIDFGFAAEDLKSGKRTTHSDLACFETWDEVQEYVAEDHGSDLKLLVKLADRFGGARMAMAIKNMVPEHAASQIYSTAHKAKGREWDSVAIGADFAPRRDKDTDEIQKPSVSERRLQYVAVTRAQMELDLGPLGKTEEEE